jgi:hypothetical protein
MSQNESKIDKKYQSDYTDARLLMSMNKFDGALNLLKKMGREIYR